MPVGLEAAGHLDQLEHRRRREADPSDEAAHQPGAGDLGQSGPSAIPEDGQRHPQAARPVVAARRGHVEMESQDQDGETGPPAGGHGEDQPGGTVEPEADRADDQPAGQGQRRGQPVGVVPEQLMAPMPEPGLDGCPLQPPEEEDYAHGKVQGRAEGPIRHGRECGPGAAQGGPEKADHEETGEPIEHARRVARMGIGDHLHIGDAAAERPARAHRTRRSRQPGVASPPVRTGGPRPGPRAPRASSHRIRGRNSRGFPNPARGKARSPHNTTGCGSSKYRSWSCRMVHGGSRLGTGPARRQANPWATFRSTRAGQVQVGDRSGYRSGLRVEGPDLRRRFPDLLDDSTKKSVTDPHAVGSPSQGFRIVQGWHRIREIVQSDRKLPFFGWT